MISNTPSDFVPNFTNDRIELIAEAILKQCYETDENLQSEFDSNYSIGCTRFDRCKNCLKNLALNKSWLSISDGSNRLVMNIDGAPFRFTRDDYQAPKKRTSTIVSETEAIQMTKFSESQQLSLDWEDKNEDDTPLSLKWRFFIDVTEGFEADERDYEIYFVGLNEKDEAMCVWKLSDHSTNAISAVDSDKPKSVTIKPVKTTLPESSIIKKKSSENKDE